MRETVDPEFLRSSDLFESQPQEVLGAVLAQGTVQEFGPGSIVFRQGEPGDRLYIVKSGVLEILASPEGGTESVAVAYLGPGDVVGEIALLTGSARTATARAPQRAELFVLDKSVFRDLMVTLPSFLHELSVVLAKRLEKTTHMVSPRATRQLQGNLRFFDLPTIMQTLIASHQTGSLVVSQEDGKNRLAELLFYDGNIARARLRHLSGDDAVYQLFQSPLEGEFHFAGQPVQVHERGTDVTLPAMNLLMEAVRLQDELTLLKQKLPDPDRRWRQKTPELIWTETETAELAAAVWSRLKKGASLADLEREIPRCSFFIYNALAGLVDSGQAG